MSRWRPTWSLPSILAASALLVLATATGVAAADPTPSPQQSASPSAEAGPTSTPDQSSEPGASPSPMPTPSVTPIASATPTPDAAAPAEATPPPASADPASPSSIPATLSPIPAATPGPTPLIEYRLSPGQQNGAAGGHPIPLYPLVTPAADTAPGAAAPASAGSPHAITTLAGADCAACHATHVAQGPALATSGSQASVCYRCHGSSGPASDVASAFSGLPANDEATDAYYAHPVADASAALHDPSSDDEFGGVANRHAVCADCHDPHNATAARPLQTTTGWTASGAIVGGSGVAVTNGAAGTAPAYALVSRRDSLTYEYQLCLTCHSGFTDLPERSPSNPSYWALDKGIELNPANAAYHPIEAAGRNQTAQMAASLAGTSPFKAWDLSTDALVRCTACHGDPSTVNQTATTSPLHPDADVAEPAHASPNRGLLTAPYRDRALKPAGEAYDAADFALCYLCHAERPFVDPNDDPSAPDTLFPLHGEHLVALTGNAGSNLSIDSPGADGGLAICAECHFRIHSSAIAYQPGDTAPVARDSGVPSLVNFAPDVTDGAGGALAWLVPDSEGAGSCTLTCHGHTHASGSSAYLVAPGTGFTATPTTGSAGAGGLTVHFTDATRYVASGEATWAWDFGDGQGSTERNPLHVYTAAGSYTVTLTVTRTAGNTLGTTLTRTDYIVITP